MPVFILAHCSKNLIFVSYFTVGTPTHYDTLEALLRLGTKYEVAHLRRDVIKHLEMVYTSDFSKFNTHHELFSESRTTHGLRAVFMARENNVTSIIPTALYYCCERSTMEIVFGIEDENGRLLKLSNEVSYIFYLLMYAANTAHLHLHKDVRTCLLAREKILDDKATVTIRKKLCKPPPLSCKRPACDPDIAFKSFWPMYTGFISKCDLFTDTWNTPLLKNGLCPVCEEQWRDTIHRYYLVLWDRMPQDYFGMPRWTSLLKNAE